MGITLKEAYSISKKKSATKSTQFPLPKVLIANSKEYKRMMELAYRHGLNTQVIHNGHIALELVIKSVLLLKIKEYPRIHEIDYLLDVAMVTASIQEEINMSQNEKIKRAFLVSCSAWDMHDRYNNRHNLSRFSAGRNYICFKECLEWIHQKYL